jgi:hypothetical protein
MLKDAEVKGQNRNFGETEHDDINILTDVNLEDQYQLRYF